MNQLSLKRLDHSIVQGSDILSLIQAEASNEKLHGNWTSRNDRRALNNHYFPWAFPRSARTSSHASFHLGGQSVFVCLAETGRSCNDRSRHIASLGTSKWIGTHIVIRYFWIHDFLSSVQITLEHLQTDEMIADICRNRCPRLATLY